MPQRRNELTPKQREFIAQFLVDLNATQAAIRAGYSRKTACEQAARLLVHVKVAAAIAAAQAARSTRTEITADRVLAEYGKIGFADFDDYAEGQFRLADKLHALDSVAKHLGMFTERHEVTGKDGAPLVSPDPSKIALVLLNILSRGRPEPDGEG